MNKYDYDNLDMGVVNLARAIRNKESSGGKNTVSALSKKEGSFGNFQYTIPTFNEQAQLLGGKDLNGNSLDINNQEHQNLVFYTWAKKLKDEGYGVDQIALAHNAGIGNIKKDYTKIEPFTNRFGNTADPRGYVNNVLKKYQELKGVTQTQEPQYQDLPTQAPQPSTPEELTLQKRAELIKEGKPVSVNPNKAEPSFFGSISRNIAKLPAGIVKSLSETSNQIENYGGATEEQKKSIPSGKGLFPEKGTNGDLSGEYLGKVKGSLPGPLSPEVQAKGGFAKGILKPVGVGAEIGSYVIGGNSGPALAKGLIGQSIKKEAFTGAVGTGLQSVGSSLQQEKSAYDTIVDGLRDTAIGLGGGIAIGFGGSSLARALKGVTPDAKDIEKAVTVLEQSYERLSSATQAGKRKLTNNARVTELKNKAGTQGSTDIKTLARDGVFPDVKDSKLSTHAKAQDYLKKTIELNSQGKKAIKELDYQVPKVNLDELESEAISLARTDKNIASGKFADMEKKIRNEFNKYRESLGVDVLPSKLDEIKSARWGNVNFNPFKSADERLTDDVDYVIAKSAQKKIENVADAAGLPDIAQFNRDMGDRFSASKYLSDLDGKAIRGSFTTRLATRIIGGSVGSSIPSKIIGMLGGDLVADMLIKNSVTPATKRIILKKIEQENPESFKQIMKYLDEQMLARDARLSLPKPSYIEGQPAPSKVQVTTGELPLGKGRVEKETYQELPR